MSRDRQTESSDHVNVLVLVEGDPQKGLSPAARYRVYAYVAQLADLGVRVTVSPSRPAKGYSQRPWHRRLAQRSTAFSRTSHLIGPLLMALWRSRDIIRAGRYDAVVLQRDLLPAYPPFLERLLIARCPTIFDVDDAIHLAPSGQSRLVRLTRCDHKIERIMAMADVTSVGSRELERHARQHARRAALMPTTVDTEAYRPTAEANGAPVVLWSGTSSNLPELERLGAALAHVAERRPFVLRVICDRPPELDFAALTVDYRRWSVDTELIDLAGAAVGVMPLSDTPWNRNKCALKLLLYGALGLPSVASPVGANADVIVDGVTGYLAGDEDEWVRSLVALLGDEQRRRRMGSAARAHIEREWSVRTWAPKWADLLRKVARGEA